MSLSFALGVLPLTQTQYYMLIKASENPAFWRIIRSSPKLVKPLFSGLRSGEIRLDSRLDNPMIIKRLNENELVYQIDY
jgi:transcription antitermination factor NusG